MEYFRLRERLHRLQQIHISLSSEVRLERLGSLVGQGDQESYRSGGRVSVSQGRPWFPVGGGHERYTGEPGGRLAGKASWAGPCPGTARNWPPSRREPVSHSILKTFMIWTSRFDYVFNPELDQRFNFRTCSALIIPLMSLGGDAVGVLELYNPREGQGDPPSFPEEWEPELMSLGAQAAVALSNAGRLAHARDVFATLVRYSASAIDARSPHTAGHSRRVAALSRALAEAGQPAEFRPSGRGVFSGTRNWKS